MSQRKGTVASCDYMTSAARDGASIPGILHAIRRNTMDYARIIGTVIAIELALLLWGGVPFRPIEAANAACD